MKSLVFISLMVVGSFASADLTGKWHGTGSLSSGTTRSVCSDVHFDVEQTAKKFYLHDAGYTCDTMVSAWQASSADIVNGELIANGKKIGTINANSISATVLSPDGKYKAMYHANLTQMGAYYTETVYDTSTSTIVLQMNAQLVR